MIYGTVAWYFCCSSPQSKWNFVHNKRFSYFKLKINKNFFFVLILIQWYIRIQFKEWSFWIKILSKFRLPLQSVIRTKLMKKKFFDACMNSFTKTTKKIPLRSKCSCFNNSSVVLWANSQGFLRMVATSK